MRVVGGIGGTMRLAPAEGNLGSRIGRAGEPWERHGRGWCRGPQHHSWRGFASDPRVVERPRLSPGAA